MVAAVSARREIMQSQAKSFRLFSIEGHINDSGQWCLKNTTTHQESTSDPIPISPAIQAVLEADFDHKRQDEVEYIVVTPSAGVRLRLENKITWRHVKNAKKGKGCIIFEDVPFSARNGLRLYTVVVRIPYKGQAKVETLNAHWKPIEGKDLTSVNVAHLN